MVDSDHCRALVLQRAICMFGACETGCINSSNECPPYTRLFVL